MPYAVEITNLKTNAVSTFRFKTESQLDIFMSGLKNGVYNSRNEHIRTESTTNRKTIEQFVIYTSLTDKERVTVTSS